MVNDDRHHPGYELPPDTRARLLLEATFEILLSQLSTHRGDRFTNSSSVPKRANANLDLGVQPPTTDRVAEKHRQAVVQSPVSRVAKSPP